MTQRITARQAIIVEGLRQKRSQKDIAADLGIAGPTVHTEVQMLIAQGVLGAGPKFGTYRVLITGYEVDDRIYRAQPRGMQVQITAEVALVEEIRRRRLAKQPRSKIARELGLNKTSLNFLLIQLGLGG